MSYRTLLVVLALAAPAANAADAPYLDSGFVYTRIFTSPGFQADIRAEGVRITHVNVGIDLALFNEGFFRILRWGVGIWQYPKKEAEGMITHTVELGGGRTVYSLDIPELQYFYIQNMIRLHGIGVYLRFHGVDLETGKLVEGSVPLLDDDSRAGLLAELRSMRVSRQSKLRRALADRTYAVTVGIHHRHGNRSDAWIGQVSPGCESLLAE